MIFACTAWHTILLKQYLPVFSELYYNKAVMTVSTKKDLIDFLDTNKTVIRQYGVKRLGVFGSFSHNTQKENSDLDLLVEFLPGQKNYDNFIGLTYFIEDTIHRKVDLITEEALSPYIGPYIRSEVEYYAF